MNQARTAFTAALVLVALAHAQRLSAVPPPKSAEEVEKESDAVVTVRVLGVVCLGEREFPDTDAKANAYQAWLQVVKVKKGTVKEGETLVVGWQDVPKTVLGPWKVEYFPGEEAQTHLKWDATARTYRSTWLNAKGMPIKKPDTDKLPTKPGEAVLAKGAAEKK